MPEIKCHSCKEINMLENSVCRRCSKPLNLEKSNYYVIKYTGEYYLAKRNMEPVSSLISKYNNAINAVIEFNKYSENKIPLSESNEMFTSENTIISLGEKLVKATVIRKNNSENKELSASTEAYAPRLETLCFNSIYAANNALTDIKDISQISVNYQTTNSFGLLANHTRVSSVKIDLIRTGKENDRLYQIAEHEYTNFFITDKSNITQKLKATNPAIKIISVQSSTNSRGQAGIGMIMGIGVQSHRKVFVLYSTDRDRPLGIIF